MAASTPSSSSSNQARSLSNAVRVYTDGASSGNPGPGGYGIVLQWRGHEKELSEGFRKTTNNRMELLAVIVALESLKRPGLEVHVWSDSKYVVDAVEKRWVFGWEKKAFKAKKNPDLWKRFLQIYRKHKVRFHWIKGHNNHPLNERCDRLAVAAAQDPTQVDRWYEENEG
jgi:ribonuclease HI